MHVPNFFGGVSGSEDRGGGDTVSSLLILRGWVTNVLKNGDKKMGVGGGRVSDNNTLTFYTAGSTKKLHFGQSFYS